MSGSCFSKANWLWWYSLQCSRVLSSRSSPNESDGKSALAAIGGIAAAKDVHLELGSLPVDVACEERLVVCTERDGAVAVLPSGCPVVAWS